MAQQYTAQGGILKIIREGVLSVEWKYLYNYTHPFNR